MGKLGVDHLEDRDEVEDGVVPGASLRAVMASFPTGVTVVASLTEAGHPVGLTVNSFTSVSLEPPLVLVCIAHGSSSHDPIVAAGGFAVSVLSAGQIEVAQRFAAWPSEGRFDEVDWSAAPSGHPVIEGASAWLDCSIREVLTAGDHSILLGRAEACAWRDEPALVFHRGVMSSLEG